MTSQLSHLTRTHRVAACLVASLLLISSLALAVDFTLYTSAKAGTTYAATNIAPDTSYTFTNDGRTLLLLTGHTTTTATITIATGATLGGYDVSDQSITLNPTATKVAGPFNTSVFNASTGKVTVTGDESTTVTVRCIKMGTN